MGSLCNIKEMVKMIVRFHVGWRGERSKSVKTVRLMVIRK